MCYMCATTGSEDIKKYCKKEENSIMIFLKEIKTCWTYRAQNHLQRSYNNNVKFVFSSPLLLYTIASQSAT